MKEEFRVIGDALFELRGSCQPEKCDSWCCRNLHFVVPKINPDDADYFRQHGCEVVERGDNLHVLVPFDCPQLDMLNMRCRIYQDRPSVCKKYARSEDAVFKSEFCTLSWKRVYGRREQIIMSKIRRGEI